MKDRRRVPRVSGVSVAPRFVSMPTTNEGNGGATRQGPPTFLPLPNATADPSESVPRETRALRRMTALRTNTRTSQ